MTIGETLGAARERAGESIHELSERTRVRPRIIEAVERDDFDACGGDFYARGHIRSLAKALGLDPLPLVEQFDAVRGKRPETSVDEIFASHKDAPMAERPRVNWGLLMAAASAAVLLFGMFHAASDADDPGGEADIRAASAVAEEPDTEGDGGEDEDDADADAASAAEEEVKLSLRAEERTWVSVSDASGNEVFTGFLTRGESRDWSGDEELQLSLGNAGGVRVEVNDENQGAVGGRGEVAHLTVLSDGVR